ncbi:hypothetical protein JFT60_10800 [Pseudomonas sp. MF6772]|uniref:hypothetical protein n=1 Tax=Pseudomonas sp. MF6772 TaxID=2797533 RepID=UPI0018E8AD34|nr:hypothetical protein [Pseudomonas sp. MF6772]MBJ2267856.1 hypothetical protein [Pseudomonas sp. MF6772]
MNDNQMINVPRNEVERLVKLLQYQAHPHPSPHAEFWLGLLDKPSTQAQGEPVAWGAPKTVRQLIRQLETLDQDLRPLSMLRVPASVFEDGKERVRATHLIFSHERVDGQWLVPFKSDGEKVLAFWCRIEQPAPGAAALGDRSPESYAIEHAEYMAKSADDVLAQFQAYGLALLAVDEGGGDGEGELFENVDAARSDLQETLLELRRSVYEFRKRRDRIARRTGETAQ